MSYKTDKAIIRRIKDGFYKGNPEHPIVYVTYQYWFSHSDRHVIVKLYEDCVEIGSEHILELNNYIDQIKEFFESIPFEKRKETIETLRASISAINKFNL